MDNKPASFGSYRLIESLGEGGMGCVWKAMDLRLERVVALKVLKGGDEVRRRALVLEAKTACQLNHPNIAVIFDAGEVDHRPYIAMELVEGLNLNRACPGAAPQETLVAVGLQAARALHHAHLKGIIHRDIKPDNLVLTAEGTLKILDFGVAKRTRMEEARTSRDFTLTEETEAGISVGTPAYMSPEQVYGRNVGPASDQFSLGTVLWEMAAGRHPFRGEALVETLHAIAKDPPPSLAALRPELPPRLVEVLQRMLQKDPGQRFASMKEVAAALEPLAGLASTLGGAVLGAGAGTQPLPPLPDPVRRAFRRRLGFAAVGVLALLALGGGAAALLRRQPAPAAAGSRRVVAVLPVETLGLGSERAWLGRSLQDAMASALLRRGDLLVLDRSRVAEALGPGGQENLNLRNLVAALKADLLVLGSLQGSGGNLRLSLRVVRSGGEILDQLQIQGQEGALLALEDELALRLPGLLGGGGRAQILPAASRARDARTRELYTKGSELLEAGQPEAYAMARSLLEEALRLEPDYAPARAALATALLNQSATGAHAGSAGTADLAERSVDEARKAVALDAGLPMAHRVLAQALLRRGDIPGARSAAQRAVDLDPADHRALLSLGEAYAYSDLAADHGYARRCYLQAMELHPGDWFVHYRLAVLLQNDGDLEEGCRQADRAWQLNPGAEYAYLTAALCQHWMGRGGEAQRRLEEGLRQVPGARLLRATRALLAHARRDLRDFREQTAGLESAWPAHHVVAILLAGLREDLEGRPQACRDRFRAFLEGLRQAGAPPSAGERRTLSVNLYHMARALAGGTDPALARELLAEAEDLHPGKQRVALADPAMKGAMR